MWNLSQPMRSAQIFKRPSANFTLAINFRSCAKICWLLFLMNVWYPLLHLYISPESVYSIKVVCIFFDTNLTMTVLWLTSASNSADHIKLLDQLFYVWSYLHRQAIINQFQMSKLCSEVKINMWHELACVLWVICNPSQKRFVLTILFGLLLLL